LGFQVNWAIFHILVLVKADRQIGILGWPNFSQWFWFWIKEITRLGFQDNQVVHSLIVVFVDGDCYENKVSGQPN
jgi:hypothetical protein